MNASMETDAIRYITTQTSIPIPLSVSLGLARRIECSIAARASGQIRDLMVVCDDDRVVLAGLSRTHHAKQIALQAALDLSEGRFTVADQIIVRRPSIRTDLS